MTSPSLSLIRFSLSSRGKKLGRKKKGREESSPICTKEKKKINRARLNFPCRKLVKKFVGKIETRTQFEFEESLVGGANGNVYAIPLARNIRLIVSPFFFNFNWTKRAETKWICRIRTIHESRGRGGRASNLRIWMITRGNRRKRGKRGTCEPVGVDVKNARVQLI